MSVFNVCVIVLQKEISTASDPNYDTMQDAILMNQMAYHVQTIFCTDVWSACTWNFFEILRKLPDQYTHEVVLFCCDHINILWWVWFSITNTLMDAVKIYGCHTSTKCPLFLVYPTRVGPHLSSGRNPSFQYIIISINLIPLIWARL